MLGILDEVVIEVLGLEQQIGLDELEVSLFIID